MQSQVMKDFIYYLNELKRETSNEEPVMETIDFLLTKKERIPIVLSIITAILSENESLRELFVKQLGRGIALVQASKYHEERNPQNN